MKKGIILLTLLSLISISFCSILYAVNKDKIEGIWISEDKDAKVEIYLAKNGKYYGKIVWLKNPEINGKPKTDINNPDQAQRDKPLMGLLILKGFTKSGNTYEDGTIYDPKSGKTYSCKMTLKDENHLSIRGYVGISALGRTTNWTKTN